MPVEIKELIIRATVGSGAPEGSSTQTAADREATIAACVEQVLEILDRSKQR